MVDCNDITILNFNEIDSFDIKKKGIFLFLNGSNFDFDYFINLKKIINNYMYIIFFNQNIEFIKQVISSSGRNFNEKFDGKIIKNVLDLKEEKVVKIDSWGFICSLSSTDFIDSIKNNYCMANSKENVLSFLLGKKFIFPLFSTQIIRSIFGYYTNVKILWYDSYLSDVSMNRLLSHIKPQIISLLQMETDIPLWAINYSNSAQKNEIKINENIVRINKLNFEIEQLKISSDKLVSENDFLWLDGNALETSIEKIINKIFPNWIKLEPADQEDLLFQHGNDIFIFEIKGTVKFINEKFITQLMKYFHEIEEKYPESEYNLFPILFINSQKNIDPKERNFEYNKALETKISKYKISVITSTRLYNLLQQKNYEQLIMKDIKTTGIHDEKIIFEEDKNLLISENEQELIETS